MKSELHELREHEAKRLREGEETARRTEKLEARSRSSGPSQRGGGRSRDRRSCPGGGGGGGSRAS